MDSENLNTQNELEDTLILNESNVISSTIIEDNCDDSVIEMKTDISVVEILEETFTSFVVEDSGVIHIRTEKVSKAKNLPPIGEGGLSSSRTFTGSAGDSKDAKTEGSILQKNESTISDIYLQLDVSDNLDVYLERERVRKLNLTKTADQADQSIILAKVEEGTDNLNAHKKNVINETAVSKKRSSKRSKEENTKKSEQSSDKENTVTTVAITGDNNKQEAAVKDETKAEIKQTDLIKSDDSHVPKSEPIDLEKKDNRFIWVSNVNKTTKATDLKMHLASYGKVQLAKIVTDGKECFGYVVMETHEDVVNCINNLQDSIFENKQVFLSDKIPEKRQFDKSNDTSKDKENRSLDKKKKDSNIDRKDVKTFKSEIKDSSDPLTLRVADSKQNSYSEERRRIEMLEHKRFLRERLSMERKRSELEREREHEKERERQREREKELRRRERIEDERQRQIEMKLEKERKKLEFERKMIEKEKLELLRYKRKLLSKEKDESSRNDHKKRRSEEEYDRPKFGRVEEPGTKRPAVDVSKDYWKNEKSSAHNIYKKGNQDVCVAPPPPPVLSNNYHAVSAQSRPIEKDRQWYERKEGENRQKPYGRKVEDSRNYIVPSDARPSYPERPFVKEQYKHKDFNLMPLHNSWSGYPDVSYKEQNIPVLRSEIPRSMQRHQEYQDGSYAVPGQDYYTGPSYRRVNDYYNRPSDRKY